MNNIYLVGFMGTGKSSSGKAAALRLGFSFVDLDECIENKEKISIPEIFAQKGEAYFRKVEKDVLGEVSVRDTCVVSCGGGIVIDQDNIALMKRTGIMVCLTASAQVIFERVRHYTHRPLLQVPDPKEKIESLLRIRAPYYAQSDLTIDTSALSVDEAAVRIIQQWEIRNKQ